MGIVAASMLLVSNSFGYFITSSSDAALAGASTINFEDQVMGTYSSITVDDVTFTSNNNHLRIDNGYQGYNQQGIYLDNGTYENNGFSALTINIASSTDAVGFTWGMAETSSPWLLTAFDASNSVLESYTLPSTGPSSAGEFFGIAASSNIKKLTLVNSNVNSYDWIAVDNFKYHAGTTSVPEPASTSLFVVSMLAFAGFLRARRSK